MAGTRKSVQGNVGPGSQRADLEEMRVGLRAAFEMADVAVKAQIAGQLRGVIKDLAALGPPPEEVSKVDELADRRARGLATTDQVSSSGRKNQVRRSGHR